MYKVNIESKTINLLFDSENDILLFIDLNNIDKRELHYKVINPFYYNSDSYNSFNDFVIDNLKLYNDYFRLKFIKVIKDSFKDSENINKYKKGCFFFNYNGLSIGIYESNLNFNDFEIKD